MHRYSVLLPVFSVHRRFPHCDPVEFCHGRLSTCAVPNEFPGSSLWERHSVS
ncbi:hypothetical protein P879_11160 [Paragonimus westermani]|uniref:Uncharacterized protein n=1 Tax=Paragonimus westermani TaxID=34504 RepID=A0A8T0DL83_9TREM|nr:hypothetical protein P879_11160 [Paragonimus westermani]